MQRGLVGSEMCIRDRYYPFSLYSSGLDHIDYRQMVASHLQLRKYVIFHGSRQCHSLLSELSTQLSSASQKNIDYFSVNSLHPFQFGGGVKLSCSMQVRSANVGPSSGLPCTLYQRRVHGSPEDGPTLALLTYIEQLNFTPPPNWKGCRELTEKQSIFFQEAEESCVLSSDNKE
eukprot:TRINITY_DN46362_c0_g1_i1.p1 TRINITY_DN46362_c0_g1~~TRINITY_DN46362_c0_g1_i1.p1  ORF type:complete len:174 (-),score=15.79 TRINITY_DN46362_c0_g1_i1:236-757(-)